MSSLVDFYGGDEERVGFILDDGSILELENVAQDPKNGFDVRAEDLIQHHGRAIATWHTHPDYSNNLSPGDAETFIQWPDLLHYIVGSNGVARYRIENGRVLRDEA